MFAIGPNEVLLLVAIGALLFGASKLPELARNLSRTKVEFMKGEIEAQKELEELEKEMKVSN